MFRVYFTFSALLMSGVASAIPSQNQEQVEQQQALQAAMDKATAELLKAGPKREGWDKGGVDLYRLVEMAPGGVAQNYLIGVDKDGKRSVTIFGAKDLNAVPKSWKSMHAVGSLRDLAGSSSLVIAHLDGPFQYAGWGNERRVGDAFCSTGKVGGQLYERPQSVVKGEIPREMISIIFTATVQMFEKQIVCWRYDRDGDGYKTSYFHEDGRTIPELDKIDEKMTIVPSRAIEALLDGTPARP